jgi:predicted RNase H-like nuclease (RuvC/YqgF family)
MDFQGRQNYKMSTTALLSLTCTLALHHLTLSLAVTTLVAEEGKQTEHEAYVETQPSYGELQLLLEKANTKAEGLESINKELGSKNKELQAGKSTLQSDLKRFEVWNGKQVLALRKATADNTWIARQLKNCKEELAISKERFSELIPENDTQIYALKDNNWDQRRTIEMLKAKARVTTQKVSTRSSNTF